MANRRMFARSITGSGRFLRMSAQARLLYYDLGMEADDDGFAEGYLRLMATGSSEEHLFELESRGFITIPDRENLVVHITDWEVNNLVRKDRYTPSPYSSLYPQCVGEMPVDKKEPQQAEPAEVVMQEEPTIEPEPMENHLETPGDPDGCLLVDHRLTQVRLGKDRIGKDRLAQDRLLTEDARARVRKTPPDAAEKPGEIQTEFLKKKQNSMDYLMNSEYFSNTRASPGMGYPV